MSEPVVARERIAQEALEAALEVVAGRTALNPYPPGSDAFAAWQASFARYRDALQAPEAEGTA